jgi:hypothetical protein
MHLPYGSVRGTGAPALSGTTAADGKPVKANFGFTAETMSPSIVWDWVEGAVVSMPDDYIAMSRLV